MLKPGGCSCTGANLDRLLRPAILACLAHSDRHGYGVQQELDALPMFRGGSPDLTGVYRALRDMEAEGLVAGDWDTPEQGRARRRFRITPDGLDCLARWDQTLEAYLAAVKDLRERTKKALASRKKRKG
jgi:DNA-binding PadR family transcriptional regulator